MSRAQLFELGKLLGWLLLTGFVIQALNPVLKWVNKRFMSKRPKDDKVRKGYQSFLRGYLKAHPYIGIVTTVILFFHLGIQYSFYGFYLSGLIAGVIMITISAFGAYGQFAKKRKPGPWLKLHRGLTLLLLLAVIFHVALAKLT